MRAIYLGRSGDRHWLGKTGRLGMSGISLAAVGGPRARLALLKLAAAAAAHAHIEGRGNIGKVILAP